MEENKTVAAAEETPVVVEETKKAPLNASVDPDKFDWDAFESDDVYGEDIKDIDAKYSQTLSKVVEGEVVEGVVTAISKREVITILSLKSETKSRCSLRALRTRKVSSSFHTRKHASSVLGIW